MESNQQDYHISFFKPTTDSARRNRNIIVQLILIWAVAIFGFQILLKVIEKPTPEKAWEIYQVHRDKLEAGSSDASVLVPVSQSALSVLGKVAIDPVHRTALDNMISWSAYRIADSAQRAVLTDKLAAFETVAATTDVVTADDYVAAKNDLIPVIQEIFALSPSDVRSKIAAVELHSSMMDSFSDENRKIVREAMDFYLIHNRSVLTDTVFLGFPFHYFYTAVFLLILFVGLCWLYCVRTDMFNKKYDIED
ncbi:MAG: sodium/substrate symporter small subunit [Bacteroidota bacterium]